MSERTTLRHSAYKHPSHATSSLLFIPYIGRAHSVLSNTYLIIITTIAISNKTFSINNLFYLSICSIFSTNITFNVYSKQASSVSDWHISIKLLFFKRPSSYFVILTWYIIYFKLFSHRRFTYLTEHAIRFYITDLTSVEWNLAFTPWLAIVCL